MNKNKRIIWGIVFVAAGILIGLNVMGILTFDIFFDGWWTLFIIVPSVIGLITEKNKIPGIIGTVLGAVILLAVQNVIDKDMILKLLVPAVIILIGVLMIFKDSFNKDLKTAKKQYAESPNRTGENLALFSSQEFDFSGQVFYGADLSAVFGGIKCDLRNAVIVDSAVINVCSVFGGIDILLPDNVNVKKSSISIFGGISDERPVRKTNGTQTVYITGNCLFGGVDIL